MNKIIGCVFKKITHKSVCSSYQYSTGVIYRDNAIEKQKFDLNSQSVSDFYAGKSVFVTGATGFIGTVLIERLIHTCKDLEKVYVLIREKKDRNAEQRLQKLLHNPVFTKLKETRPQDLNKIVAIAGDVRNEKIGMNTDDEQTLIEKVSVIFHSAANVKFKKSLGDLMQDNYVGTKNVLEMAKRVKKLDIFVHTSTIFHNSKSSIVEEIPRTHPKKIEDVNRIITNHSNKPREIRKLLDDWGNCYLLSKIMAEAHVGSNHENISTIIIRPSMVTSVYKEPLEGYADSWVAVTSLLCDISSGLTHIVRGDKRVSVEIIPVDYVCNFMIVAAAKNNRTKICNTYNFSTGTLNPVTWKKLTDTYVKEGKKHDYEIMPFPWVYFTKAIWLIPALTFLTQILPAFAADVWLLLTGRKPRYIKLQKNAMCREKILTSPVTLRPWNIKMSKTRDLLSTMNDKDKQTFPCDPATINWDKYIPIYCRGVKKYMMASKNK